MNTLIECINIGFSEKVGIFDNHYGYPEIDDKEKHNGPTGKVKDTQGPQAHPWSRFPHPQYKITRFRSR